MKPLPLQYLGGKHNHPVLGELRKVQHKFKTLIDPFLGTASSVFLTNFRQYRLSDSNPDLICYLRCVRDHPKELLEQFEFLVSRENYYAIRDEFNATNFPDSSQQVIYQASRFMYLSLYCFNGVLRYNRAKQVNTPVGSAKNRKPIDEAIFTASKRLVNLHLDVLPWQSAIPENCDYSDCLLYCDPPYHSEQTKQLYFSAFEEGEQLELIDHIEFLVKYKNLKAVICNADTSFTRKLFRSARVQQVEIRRSVAGGKIGRGDVSELIAFFGF